MKKKSILGLIIGLFGFGFSVSSCEDMLTPDMTRYTEGFTGTDTVNFYLGILGNVQEMLEQNILLGDLRSDLTETTSYSSDSISDIINLKQTPDGENALLNRAAYYKVINQCNFYLAKVDSMASKNGTYYMRKEMAQVLLIRAWTYMQLVQNYGKVPFITVPVDNANTGWEKNPPAWATPDNLVELLHTDCEQALAYQQQYGNPNYNSFNTGQVTYDHRYMLFPPQVVLGDLYLLRGASKQDYINAARYYYDYLNDNNASGRYVKSYSAADYFLSYTVSGGVRHETYVPEASGFTSFYSSSSTTGYDGEAVTLIPSASQRFFGRTLTRIPQIYGFDPSSSVSTADDENNTQSGRINVTANYKNRQVAPSARYEALNKAQTFAYRDRTIAGDNEDDYAIEYLDAGDARYYGTAPEVQTEAGRLRFVQKYCGSNRSVSSVMNVGSFNFRYNLTIYRLHQIHLRYAEALNRAGYPRYAYAVLNGGLNYEYIPEVVVTDTIYDDEAQTVKYVYGVEVDSSSTASYKQYCIDANEQLRAQADPNYDRMLLIEGNAWQNCGIHDLGNGIASNKDTVNDYAHRVAQRIQEESLRRQGFVTAEARRAAIRLTEGEDTPVAGEGEGEGEGEGDSALDEARKDYTVLDPDLVEPDPLEIDAVESLIADETALDMGFEGMRYYDLMRIARHKNADQSGVLPSDNGSTWFAWQIARRSKQLGLYESPQEYDVTIFEFLRNPSNWYLRSPEY